jgi:hypothetical protein
MMKVSPMNKTIDEVKLVHYEAARAALSEAKRVDEVKDVRDQAIAMRAYAMQAKDRDLIDCATDIRLRAERRAGELLAEVEKNTGVRSQLQGRDVSGGSIVRPPEDEVPTLSELGVSRTQSSRWQKIAKLDERAFEDIVLATKDRAFESME